MNLLYLKGNNDRRKQWILVFFFYFFKDLGLLWLSWRIIKVIEVILNMIYQVMGKRPLCVDEGNEIMAHL